MKISKLAEAGRAILAGQMIEVPQIPGVSLLVVGSSNPAVRRLGAKLFSALPKEKRDDPAEIEKIEKAQALDAILKGWDGLTDDEGQAMPYSYETAKQWLADPAISTVLMEAINYASAQVGRIEADNEKADAKN